MDKYTEWTIERKKIKKAKKREYDLTRNAIRAKKPRVRRKKYETPPDQSDYSNRKFAEYFLSWCKANNEMIYFKAWYQKKYNREFVDVG